MDSKSRRTLRTVVAWLHLSLQGLILGYIYFSIGGEITGSAEMRENLKHDMLMHIGVSIALFAMYYTSTKLLSSRHSNYKE